jgi:hypothetical protein
MDKPQFAVFKYRHEGHAGLDRVRQVLFYIGLAVALIATFADFPAGVAVFFAPLLVYISAARKLSLGTRYLLCGNDIVYYGNVTRLALSEKEGKLSVRSANGKTFVLERERFPTGARKADKIKKNRAAKFGKVAAKIVDKVRKASPAVELVGI